MLAGRPVSRVLSRRETRTRMAIYLARRLPVGSSSLPGSRGGPDQPCSPIWPCSRWGLPSQPVARLLVRSYRTVSPLPQRRKRRHGGLLSVALSRSPGCEPRPVRAEFLAEGRWALPTTASCGARTFLCPPFPARKPSRNEQRPSGRPASIRYYTRAPFCPVGSIFLSLIVAR